MIVFAVAMTITTGSWIAGVPTLVRDTLGHGPAGFSLVMIGFAVGSIGTGIALTRIGVRSRRAPACSPGRSTCPRTA